MILEAQNHLFYYNSHSVDILYVETQALHDYISNVSNVLSNSQIQFYADDSKMYSRAKKY